MTTTAVHLDSPSALADDDRLRDRLRAVGMAVVYCNDAGEIEKAARSRSSDWLMQLVRSPLIARFIKTGAAAWADDESPAAIEPIPGLWLAPIPLPNRPRPRVGGTSSVHSRRRPCAGYAVLVLLTESLVMLEGGSAGGGALGSRGRGEGLSALCQSAGMDYELTAGLLVQLGLASDSEAGRLLSLARYMYEDHVRQLASERAMESTGQQLAESYEEISLLYTIIQSMTVVEQPERFVTIACEELLDTLPYEWIGAQLCANRSRLKQLAGRFFMAGALPVQEGRSVSARSQVVGGGRGTGGRPPNPLILKLLHMMQPDAPMVIEPLTNEAHGEYRPLGNTVLVHPVTSDGEVIGLLAAGEKHGPDTSASNVDMKLLGAIASHMAIFLENAALYDDLNATFLGTLEALTASIDAKDRYTCGHSQRVAHLTQQLARVIGLDANVVKRMHIAGLVHDVGKIGVPEGLLLKPGKLTDEEFAWIQRHPEIGHRILKDIPQLQDILPGVLYHHERWDGCGYPKGLAGEEIPQVARLIGLADAFDAMSSTRTYRSAMDRKQVLKEIERCAGTQFDPSLVPAFIELDFREYDRMMVEHRAGGASPGISSAA